MGKCACMRLTEKEKKNYGEFAGRRRRRGEKDVESHGTAECWTEMFKSFVETTEHLRAADLCRLCLHLLLLCQCELK